MKRFYCKMCVHEEKQHPAWPCGDCCEGDRFVSETQETPSVPLQSIYVTYMDDKFDTFASGDYTFSEDVATIVCDSGISIIPYKNIRRIEIYPMQQEQS